MKLLANARRIFHFSFFFSPEFQVFQVDFRCQANCSDNVNKININEVQTDGHANQEAYQ